ncbi:hypothetical protein QU481_15615 [Crenobacter sp. SG2303]|uniref:LysM domain-containing protein n=1 Tax=Crenobacter oryzisoli TaxID=3056844 RepID=A0ABT7XMQ4_9NEIS|nr:hypothetical protein [Crenobacter sp. SG2303]MDN0075079.1 hypothetical protein [Crenobacter sp. SG2303]MDN0076313.1 hypothetical protein [Crenobacter sp. SG2303]
MPITVISNEKTVKEVITKLYGELSATQLDSIMAATLAANPHLSESATLTPGMVVIVPSQAAVATPAGAGNIVSGDAVGAICAALSDYGKKLSQKIVNRQRELNDTANILNNADFQKVVGPKLPEGFIEGVINATESEQAKFKQMSHFIESDLKTLNSDLEKLSGKLF